MRKYLLILIILIFLLSIFIQLYYLTEYFNSDVFIVDREVPIDPDFISLFSNDENDLNDTDGIQIYSSLLNTDYNNVNVVANNYSNDLLIDYLDKIEVELNGNSVKTLVFVIGARNGQSSPSAPGASRANIWFNIAGEFVKRINNEIYVYSGLVPVSNVNELQSKKHYIEGWVLEEARYGILSTPKKSDILKLVEENDLCMETDTPRSRLFDLSALATRYENRGSTGYNRSGQAFYKVTYDGDEVKKFISRSGIASALRGEVKSIISNVYKDGKRLYNLTYPYCGDFTKMQIQARGNFDIELIDIYLGSADSIDGDMVQPLQEVFRSEREVKEIDFTKEITMTDNCARLARSLIKRENGYLLNLYHDIGRPVCNRSALVNTLQTELIRMKDGLIRRRDPIVKKIQKYFKEIKDKVVFEEIKDIGTAFKVAAAAVKINANNKQKKKKKKKKKKKSRFMGFK